MSFEKASNFLFIAAEKYRLPATESLVCEKMRQLLKKNFGEKAADWNPQKFSNQKLVIAAQNSAAASALFLRTNQILELCENDDFLSQVKEIAISRPRT